MIALIAMFAFFSLAAGLGLVLATTGADERYEYQGIEEDERR